MGVESQTVETALRLFEILSIIGGGAIVLFRLGRAIEKVEQVGQQQGVEITALKDGVKQLADIMIKQALTNQRLDNLGERMNRQDKQIDEMRHGEGFVYPLGSHLTQQKG